MGGLTLWAWGRGGAGGAAVSSLRGGEGASQLVPGPCARHVGTAWLPQRQGCAKGTPGCLLWATQQMLKLCSTGVSRPWVPLDRRVPLKIPRSFLEAWGLAVAASQGQEPGMQVLTRGETCFWKGEVGGSQHQMGMSASRSGQGHIWHPVWGLLRDGVPVCPQRDTSWSSRLSRVGLGAGHSRSGGRGPRGLDLWRPPGPCLSPASGDVPPANGSCLARVLSRVPHLLKGTLGLPERLSCAGRCHPESICGLATTLSRTTLTRESVCSYLTSSSLLVPVPCHLGTHPRLGCGCPRGRE